MTEDTANKGYAPTDLVYVDPETRTVISKVEWTSTDQPKSLSRVEENVERERGRGRGKRRAKKKVYPFGTYKSMCHAFRLEGKKREEEERGSLEEVLPRILDELWL